MMVVTDRARVRSLAIGFELARQLRALYGEKWRTKELDRLLGNQKTAAAILQGSSLEDIHAAAAQESKSFTHRRTKFLLYP